MTPAGAVTTLHQFDYTDGDDPEQGIVQASDGNFYGTTFDGGTGDGGVGVLFMISTGGVFNVLYDFNGIDGEFSTESGALVQGIDGNFYGTTLSGTNLNNFGGVYKFSVPITPPNTITAFEANITNAVVTITSILGATYQLQYRDSMISGAWSNVPGAVVTNGPGAALSLTNTAAPLPPNRFYRVQITP